MLDGTLPLAPQPALDACRVEDAATAGEGFEPLVLKRGVKADRALLDNDHVLTTAAPEMTWLPLNVAVVDNDRGASPNSYRARALGAGAQQVPPVTPWMYTRWRVVERERARWHDPVLGRLLGLTPEQPALCLRGFPRRPRAAPSRVSGPPSRAG
eukprot:scaffold11672_cov62-Phaeocystis_antarctica.AAC.2